MSNPITEALHLLPAPVRKTIYALLFLAALVFGVYQATEGDWLLFVGGVLTSLTGLLAAGNTDTEV